MKITLKTVLLILKTIGEKEVKFQKSRRMNDSIYIFTSGYLMAEGCTFNYKTSELLGVTPNWQKAFDSFNEKKEIYQNFVKLFPNEVNNSNEAINNEIVNT